MSTRKFGPNTPGVLPGQDTAPHPQDLPQIARITKVTAAGAWFTTPAWADGEHGPAPWSLGSYATVAAAITAGYKPLVGDTALVVFAGAAIGTPVIVAWWR